ncbi:DUF3365 domain-containing protein [Alphaproteobacteria bacterium KMM 3653]|uniref:DUF3365 domain-containing protein n=1 Tax=Harenicola maris TaxID=2841044 RepID=A0AAP2CRU3_9RHOB|nr:DUF3365 domain-containing protein [Harenicola maris]
MTTLRLSIIGSFACLAIYLFATAPAPLPEVAPMDQSRVVQVENMFNAVNAINDAARSIYTQRIVGEGLKAGLKFSEDWAEPGVEAGPLPALFLRLAAGRMEAKPAPLGLYLGSDAPINQSNLFRGGQAEAFAQVKATREALIIPQGSGGLVGMYPDVASAAPCVSCHNEHADSPKTDWKLNDMMGATTWTYPKGQVPAAESLEVTEAFFASVEEAYGLYLAKAASFETPPPIGTEWPAPGQAALPDLASFMAEVRAKAAEAVMFELVLINSERSTNLRNLTQ